MPIVTYWNAVDLIEDDNPLYCGRAGNMGDRPGNWAIQNADLILAVGTRISIRQTGYNWKTWARAAKVIMVDVDKAELKKPTIHVEMPVWADAKDFLTKLDKAGNSYRSCISRWRVACNNTEMEKGISGSTAKTVGGEWKHCKCIRICKILKQQTSREQSYGSV